MAPSVSANFISLITSLVGLREEEPQNSPSHVLYMGVSYSYLCAHGTLNTTQSINQSVKRHYEEPIYSMSHTLFRCVACDCDLTIEHSPNEYGDFAELKTRYHDAENMTTIPGKVLQKYLTYHGRLDCFIEYWYCLSMNTCEQKCNVESF